MGETLPASGPHRKLRRSLVGIANGGNIAPVNPLLDLESRRAVHATVKVSPLPERYTPQTLTVYLIFEYRR